ncbi:MAG: hypothetical protein JST54_21050 [Deltaproteobacteria bacterium]|nr:hypothetical protein [Deltaproteobacteria bacterium]
MEFQPINLSEICGIVFGMSIFIIPVLGVTLRYAIKPLLDSYAQAFPSQGRIQLELERLNRRVTELEDELSKRPALPESSRDRLALAPSTTEVVVSR